MHQQESEIKKFEEYLSEFRDERDALELWSSLNSTWWAREGRWRAQGGWARHCTSPWLCPLPGVVLWRGVLSDDKNNLGIFLNFFGNIFCVTFSETQKQSNSSNKNF